MTESSPNQPPIAIGTVLAGKYKVARILGQGGMGIVVEAKHIALDERVALKFLLPEYASHPEAAARFLREARAAVKIKSEHVARVSDVGTLDTGAPYMVMEYLEGDDLSKILEKRGVLAIPEAIDYVIQGCEAIAEAHSHGIVHRDLKPANLFLTRRQDGYPLVKVLDFGISKTMGNVENLTKTMAAMGSALYMSPEQMQQTRSVDHRTDIYALGISLYELLAGKQPFFAETLPQLCAEILTGTPTPIRQARPDVPEMLAVALERAYARDRAQRYGSVAEFVVALAPWAPNATRHTIERIARMGGVSLMSAPDHRPPMPSAPTGPAPTQAMPQVAQPPTALSQSQPAGATAQSQPAGVMGPAIIPGHYQAPHSARASAAFANNTNANLSTTGPTRTSSGGKAALVIGLLLAASLAAAGFFLLRRVNTDAPKVAAEAPSASADAHAAAPPHAESAAPAPPASPPSATPSAAPAAPSATESAAPAETASAAASASAAPSATPVAPRNPGRAPPRRAPEPPPPRPVQAAPASPGVDLNSIPGGRFDAESKRH